VLVGCNIASRVVTPFAPKLLAALRSAVKLKERCIQSGLDRSMADRGMARPRAPERHSCIQLVPRPAPGTGDGAPAESTFEPTVPTVQVDFHTEYYFIECYSGGNEVLTWFNVPSR
jgi:hypothetical protein